MHYTQHENFTLFLLSPERFLYLEEISYLTFYSQVGFTLNSFLELTYLNFKEGCKLKLWFLIISLFSQ